jgi:hypothetical protein
MVKYWQDGKNDHQRLLIYLFSYGLLNNIVSRSDYIALNDRMINE